MAGVIRSLLAILWASPWSLLGLVFGGLALLTGGGVARHGRVLEFAGGVLVFLLRRLPLPGGARALTLGHVVLGRTAQSLAACRDHESVHVRQYERWGALFVPAYLGCSLLLLLYGRDPYRDNPFEREAFDEAE
jgi:hypothetical protein